MAFRRLRNMWKLWKQAQESRVNHALTEADRSESIAVRSLKKQLRVMDEIQERQKDLISTLSKQVSEGKMSIEEMMVTALLPKLLSSGNMSLGNTGNANTVESYQNSFLEQIQQLSPNEIQKYMSEKGYTQEEIQYVLSKVKK